MTSFGTNRLTRLGIGACLALLIHGLCASQSARAGCSHLVGPGAHRSSELTRLDPHLLGDDSASPAVDETESLPGRHFPCSGPSCSDNAPPPASPGVLTTDRLDQWGTLSTLFGFSPIIPRMTRPADAALRPIGRPALIFHPPRMDRSITI
jgi:hypothetical protein